MNPRGIGFWLTVAVGCCLLAGAWGRAQGLAPGLNQGGAQGAQAAGLWSRVRAQQITDLLRSMGVQHRQFTDRATGNPVWALELGKLKAVLIAVDTRRRGDGSYNMLEMGMSFALEGMPPQVGRSVLRQRVNDWNASQRFCVAFLTDRDCMLAGSLCLVGGVGVEAVRRFVRRFEGLGPRFADQVVR